MGIFKNDDQKSSQFGFDEKSMAGKAVKAVRWIYAITGVLALVAGIALLFAPAKSLVFLTTVLGFYFGDHGRDQAVYRCFRAAAAHRLARDEHHLQPTHYLGRRHNPAQPGLLDRDAHHDGGYRGRLWLDRRRCHVHSGVRAFVQPCPRHPERRALHHRRHVRVYLSAVVGQDARHL